MATAVVAPRFETWASRLVLHPLFPLATAIGGGAIAVAFCLLSNRGRVVEVKLGSADSAAAAAASASLDSLRLLRHGGPNMDSGPLPTSFHLASTTPTGDSATDALLSCGIRIDGTLRGVIKGRTEFGNAQDVPVTLRDAIVLVQVKGEHQAILYSSWDVAGRYGDFMFDGVPHGTYWLQVASPYAKQFLTLLQKGDVRSAASRCLTEEALRYVPLRVRPVEIRQAAQ